MLSVIVALARNRVIGVDNRLPWHLPEDLKHFKALTLGHHMIMGRKTYESIGRPLPGRTTVIVSRDPAYAVPGCLTAHSLEQAIALSADDPETFCVGGSSLYVQALPIADRLYITEIHADYAGDAHFPAIEPAHWQETARQAQTAASGLVFDFVRYDRRR